MAKTPSDGSDSPARTLPPKGQPALRTIAMPADANPNGDIFGGWVLSQMDIAADRGVAHTRVAVADRGLAG